MVAALMICASLGACGKKDETKPDDKSTPASRDGAVVMESEHFKIDNTMMSFFFREAFMNTYQSYLSYFGSEMMAYLGLDASTPLKDQPFSMGDEEGIETWYDYFLKMAIEQAETCLIYREAAEEAGITIDDEDQANIDSIIDSINSSAEQAGVTVESYYEDLLGKGVTEEVLRECLELETYASKYVTSVIEAADLSDEAAQAAYEADPLSYDVVSYMSYTFSVSELMDAEKAGDGDAEAADEETEEDPAAKEAAAEKIKGYADELAAADGEEAFHEYIYNYEVDVLGQDESTAEMIASYALVEGAGYSEELDASKWAFSAKAGDTKTETDEETGNVTVYLLVKERARDESSDKRSVRHILFGNDEFDDAGATAKEVYDQWVADGAKMDDFLALVTEYSTDPGSNTNGGLYEFSKDDSLVEEFKSWMFDDARKDGDYGLVESTYGWHIMYMESVGEPAWMTLIKSELKSKAYEDNYNELTEKYQVTVHEELIDVPDIAEPAETEPADTATEPVTEPATEPADSEAPATGD